LGALIYLWLAGFHQRHSFQDRLPITEQCSSIFFSSRFNGSNTQLNRIRPNYLSTIHISSITVW
jgi:hypothetical protein